MHDFMEDAHTGGFGDGIICILPAEKIYRIRTTSEAKADDIQGCSAGAPVSVISTKFFSSV
jgi:hypothetical protein